MSCDIVLGTSCVNKGIKNDVKNIFTIILNVKYGDIRIDSTLKELRGYIFVVMYTVY